MVASIGVVASPAQGASYYEREGYYAKDDPAHREASRWAGKGAEALGLAGPVDPDTFRAILEGKVPDGPQLGRRGPDGEFQHRPGRDVTLSAPKSVSLLAMVGGDERIVAAHDQAVGKTLAWIEEHAVRTRVQDKATGAMIRTDGQKMVAATFRHDTSRNLDPQLHTHCVIANMVQGGDGKWRTMVNDGIYQQKMAIGAIYRAELAEGLRELGYRVEKTHADGRFEIAGVPRDVIEAFSTRRAEIEAAMAERGLGTTAENPYLADRATLMTRATKRDMDKAALQETWQLQARALGFSADAICATARQAERDRSASDLFTHPGNAAGDTAGDAARWAVEHLSERQAVFGHTDLLAATLGRDPGAVTVAAAERVIAALEHDGSLHAARGLDHGRHWTTDAALGRESETIALMRADRGAGKTIMRGWIAETKLRIGRLNEGQKAAVKTILAAQDRVIGVQGYAGTGKTTMLKRLRMLAERRGYRVAGLAPSASAAQTLGREAGIESETLQRFLARHAGVIESRGTTKGLRNLRGQLAKTVLVVDESSLASSEQMRGLFRAATTLRLARVVLVGDEKQLGAVEAGKPFAQLRAAGMQTVVMDEIVRQRDAELKEAVRASLAGEVQTAFAKLGGHIAQVEKNELGAEAAARWLALSPERRASTGVIAPTRALRDTINDTIRANLVAEGAVAGPAREGEKLVSRGLTRAEMTVAANYAPGDTVIFNRAYKTLGVEAGDERRVTGVDRQWKRVDLADDQGRIVKWAPERLAAAKGGVEVYRGVGMELRAGDRVRWTRNDPGFGLVNGATATVERVDRDGVRFRLEDGSAARLAAGDPQLRHLDRAWAATVHAFQGRTVDRIIAAMPADHARLTTQQAFYVAISRARDRAELVTDHARKLADQLEKATGERVAALDGVALQAAHETELRVGDHAKREPGHAREAPEAAARGRDSGLEVPWEYGRGSDPRQDTGRDRDGNLPEPGAERHQGGRDSGRSGHWRGRSHVPEREAATEKSMEPAQKSVDLDLGM
ncbi:MAG: relaxase domain-containing protein [Rhodospirillales bacterium]|nr:relaxase domain-containing protein [Rhodospirillales bacterium]